MDLIKTKSNTESREHCEDHLSGLTRIPGFVFGYYSEKEKRNILFFENPRPQDDQLKAQEKISVPDEIIDHTAKVINEINLKKFIASLNGNHEFLSLLTQSLGALKLVAMKSGNEELADIANTHLNIVGDEFRRLLESDNTKPLK